jgi:hypothetical protein
MNNANSIPKIVSKRNEFTPADEFVENAIPYLPKEFQHVNFRAWLLTYTEGVIKGVASHFGLAAERGIAQAAQLLCDPEFYETRRQRRAKWRKDMENQHQKAELERIERKVCPTAEQVAHDIKWCEDQLSYHQSEVSKCVNRLEELRELKPKNIRIISKRVQ